EAECCTGVNAVARGGCERQTTLAPSGVSVHPPRRHARWRLLRLDVNHVSGSPPRFTLAPDRSPPGCGLDQTRVWGRGDPCPPPLSACRTFRELASALPITCRVQSDPREKLHQFIDRTADERDRAALHAAIDALDDALLPEALRRMRALHARV